MKAIQELQPLQRQEPDWESQGPITSICANHLGAKKNP